jgi:hypothetical protein
MAKSLQSDYEQIVKESERLFKSLDRSSRKEYAALLKSVRAEVSEVYAKYANNDGVLTYAEMQKFNRLKSLKQNIDDVIKTHTQTVQTQLTAILKDDIRQSYSQSASLIGDAAGVSLTGKIQADAISAILKKPAEGWTISERMLLRQRDLAVRLQGTVTNGFVHGDSLQDAAKAIKTTVEKDFARFRSFAGDTIHRVSQDAVSESIKSAEKEADIKVIKVWVTAGDDRVRDAHALLDGQEVRGDENFTIPSGEFAGYQADAPQGFGEPALDRNCRCRIAADVVKR